MLLPKERGTRQKREEDAVQQPIALELRDTNGENSGE